MTGEIKYSEPSFIATYPTTVRLREGRVVFGVRKATEFTVVPAISRVSRMPDKGWFSTITVIGGKETPKGLDLGDKVIDGVDDFNAFCFESSMDLRDTYDSFRTALITGSKPSDIHPVGQLELEYSDMEKLYSFITLNALQHIDRIIPCRTNDPLARINVQ